MDGSDVTVSLSRRLDEYWSWVAAALFLLITIDGLTTLFAAQAVGLTGETNPIVRWALGQGMGTFLVLNLAATVVAVVLFYGLIELVRASSGRPAVALSLILEGFLGLLLAVGLAIFANNLAVIVLRRSLFAFWVG